MKAIAAVVEDGCFDIDGEKIRLDEEKAKLVWRVYLNRFE